MNESMLLGAVVSLARLAVYLVGAVVMVYIGRTAQADYVAALQDGRPERAEAHRQSVTLALCMAGTWLLLALERGAFSELSLYAAMHNIPENHSLALRYGVVPELVSVVTTAIVILLAYMLRTLYGGWHSMLRSRAVHLGVAVACAAVLVLAVSGYALGK